MTVMCHSRSGSMGVVTIVQRRPIYTPFGTPRRTPSLVPNAGPSRAGGRVAPRCWGSHIPGTLHLRSHQGVPPGSGAVRWHDHRNRAHGDAMIVQCHANHRSGQQQGAGWALQPHREASLPRRCRTPPPAARSPARRTSSPWHPAAQTAVPAEHRLPAAPRQADNAELVTRTSWCGQERLPAPRGDRHSGQPADPCA